VLLSSFFILGHEQGPEAQNFQAGGSGCNKSPTGGQKVIKKKKVRGGKAPTNQRFLEAICTANAKRGETWLSYQEEKKISGPKEKLCRKGRGGSKKGMEKHSKYYVTHWED